MSQAPLTTLIGTLRCTSAQALDGLSDAELLRRYREGRDEPAFAALVKRHGPLVLSACRQLLADPADVDDAFQAAFLTLIRQAKSIRDGAALSGWLYRVAYRIALRVRQRAARQHELGECSTHEPDLSWREACAVLHEELDRLPEQFRLPLVLCYLDGRSRDEAAKQLGWTEGMVKGRLERGRNALRERLVRRGVTLSAGLLAALAVRRSEAISPRLMNSVLRFVPNPGAAPAALAALGEGVFSTMTAHRPWLLLAAVVTVGLIGASAALIARPRPADPPIAKPGTQPAQPEPASSTLAGRIVDPDGKPIAGARLYWPKLPKDDVPRSPEDLQMPMRATSDEDGRFRVELPKEDVRPDLPIPLVAAADGFGVGWVETPKLGGSHDLTLWPEHLIQGRVIDTQGKPLADLDVQIVGMIAPRNLDEFTAAWKREWETAGRQSGRVMYFPLVHVIGKSKTNAQGRFELKGVARDHVAMVQIGGPTVSQQSVYVVNRPGFDAAAINRAVLDKNPQDTRVVPLSGPQVECVAAPTKVIDGIVKDALTGRPIAGARVSSAAGHGDVTMAVTDIQGRFRLAGLPKRSEYLVTISPPRELATLMMRTIRLSDSEGFKPIRADVELNHGVLVTGQVIDKSTGKPVQAAVRCAPLPDNKYFGKRPGSDSYRNERLMHPTDAEGRFRFAALPGTGVLMAQARGEIFDGQPIKPWRHAEFDADDRKKVEVNESDPSYRYFATAGNAQEGLNIADAVKWVDLREGAGAVTVNLYLHRGLTQTVTTVDSDGKPVNGVMASGVTDSYPVTFLSRGASHKIYALDAKTPRTVVFVHPQRQIAAVAQVRGDEKGPLTVKLAPTATIKGRMLDLDGQPLAGVQISESYADEVGRELIRFLQPPRSPVRTDADGRFELTGVVPGLRLSLGISKERNYFVGEPRIGLHTLKAGETLDLGDRKLKAQR